MAQITEDYVSFKISKLLQEKGFDGRCRAGYTHYGSLSDIEVKEFLTNETCPDTHWECVAPTLQMAMKWLREVHDLNINIELSINGYFCSISHIVRDSSGHVIDVEDSEAWETAYYDTYEEACEAEIKYCLENLI